MRRNPSERVYLDLLVDPSRLNIVPIVQHAVEEVATWPFPRRVLTRAAEAAAQANMLRDVAGNPFHQVTFDPAWRTSDVLALARGIYEWNAFDRMPILADALQDAGCENEDILGHCRDPLAAHVRGCWVVDLVLGKE